MDLQTVDTGLLQSRYRLTKQRAAVLRALNDGSHLTAESIHERVRLALPSVSLGTVYRTLDILRQLGLVQMFNHSGNAALYEATLDKHHHLLCTRCHTLTNVHADGIAQIAQGIANQAGYADTEFALTVFGRCPNCRR
jgi:Fe2+ or Zn2+ uptake regulation protein